jgi:uncharacterized protein (DUF433 family)
MFSPNMAQRIVVDSKIMVGKPVIRGTRLTVQYILELLAQGGTPQQIIAEYSGITQEDIAACLIFAAQTLGNTSFIPSPVGA